MTSPGFSNAWVIDQRWMKAYPLTDVTLIGRGPESTVLLRDPAVSRAHAEIRREGNAWILKSVGTAGTNLNGVRVSTDCVLQEGDLIEIALTTLRFTQRAPTGEMFVVRRDAVHTPDGVDVPTRPTLHGMHPITLIARWQKYWHLLLGLLLIVLVLAICAGSPD